ncbi:acyl-CoA dehydrogenase family protein [Burkholderia sp. Ax-1719]|uniref:acyl-CoA dehydrogenase family protein n=1 Tax=Burkholderia sp. Ax-1719 TaxID=2608334 RepID=UPI00141EE99D|nr:acyl-CoA dehydrogenase family protein [Burkholderia sp. Ax-1719]NIE63688.1 acyl-CoA dehydrogenase [Burkholderia sp. Ax-1719]
MDFSFDEDQEALADGARRFLMTELTPELIRELWESETGRSERHWAQLAEQGMTAVSVPQAQGGLGLSAMEWALLAQTWGYFGGPDPLIDTAFVSVALLQRLPASDWRDTLLAQIATGGARVALSHPVNPYVADAHVAHVLLCERDGELHRLAPSACSHRAVESVDPSRRLFSLDWTPDASTRIADASNAAPLLDLMLDHGAFSVAAQLLGLTQRVLDAAIDYTSQRKQFGKPIGAYQAVKHLLADVAIRYEFARPVVYRAACALATDDPQRALHVSHAKLAALSAAQLAARHAIQVHGAMGYTWELDLQIFVKRIWALAGNWGDATYHRERVARTVIDARASIGPASTFVQE